MIQKHQFMKHLKHLVGQLSLQMDGHHEVKFIICCTGSKRVHSRVVEMSELGERGLDSLLELLDPIKTSSYCWHILIH